MARNTLWLLAGQGTGLVLQAVYFVFVARLLGTAVVGSLDEWHQSFHPNRTASVWDVLLDCSGAIGLQLIVYIYMRVYRPKQLVRAE